MSTTISSTLKASDERPANARPYSVYVYPNIGRALMGSGNPYIEQLKKAIGMHHLAIDQSVTDKAFPEFLVKGLRSDMVVLNWLENLPLRKMGLVQTVVVMIYLRLLKLRGTTIVWIKHNKVSHTTKGYKISRLIQKALVRCADHIVTHSSDIDIPHSEKLVYLPHPSNIGPEAIAVPSKDEQPVIDLLIWGSLLPYKGVLEFLEFARKEPAMQRLKIFVIGKSAPDYWEQLQAAAGPNVTLSNKFIETDELTQLFNQTRFILFTYNKRSVMSSGVLIDSLAACRKIIAPDCGAFRDLARQQSFVQLYNDLSDIPALCRQHWDDYTLDYEEVCEFVARNSWYNMGQKIKELADL
ncbi:MAG: hypothetical protein JST42_08715 [Bacteroidetes bacterium]|nr:hypothetical protein [Bacteroidota bacterium]